MGLRMDLVGGGKFKQAVQQLIEIETQPIKILENRQLKERHRLQLLKEFQNKFSGFESTLNEMTTFKKFRELKVDLGNGNSFVEVTLNKEKAEPGKYQIIVESLAQGSSSITNGFDSPDEPIFGAGFIYLSSEKEGSTEIYVNDQASSLQGIAHAINENSKAPVRASVIRDDSDASPWKLLLVSKKSGEIQEIDLPEFYFLESQKELLIEDHQEAKNASFSIDGFAVESDSNSIPNFLPGVHLNLNEAHPEKPFFLNISEDYKKISGKIKNFLNQINEILTFIIKQNALDQDSDTSNSFGGDSSLQSIEYKIRNLIHQPYLFNKNIDKVFLNQIGIEFEKTGLINFKEEKFNQMIESDFEKVTEIITGEHGLVEKFKLTFENYLRKGDGLLSIKEQGINLRIKDIDRQIEHQTQLIDKRKQAIIEKFSKLQSTLAKLQSQQQYLSAALPHSGSMLSQMMSTQTGES